MPVCVPSIDNRLSELHNASPASGGRTRHEELANVKQERVEFARAGALLVFSVADGTDKKTRTRVKRDQGSVSGNCDPCAQ